MVDEIISWLNSDRNFNSGILLLEKYGDKDLATILKNTQSNDKGRRLFFRLKLMLKPIPSKAISKPIEPGAKIITQQHHTQPSFNRDATKGIVKETVQPSIRTNHYENLEIAHATKRNADRLYKELSNKRAELFLKCNVDESPFENNPDFISNRALLVREIMRLQKNVDKAYEEYRFVIQYGRASNTQANVLQDPILLHQSISNLRKSISKIKCNKKLGDEQKNMALLPKQQALEQLLKQYEEATIQH